MNAIRTINLTKQILLISFVFFLSCKKQTEVSSPPQKPLSENAFFSRAKISANQSDRDLVDTIIDFCKSADDISHFSKVVMEKYGHPKWDLTLTLNNENGLKSLMVPVADTSNQVKLIIFAYQDTKDHVIFKFVGRNTPQPGLPLATNSGKTLTKESLVGIFNALDKRVMASKIQLNSSMENVKTNNTYVSSLCWLITWHYGDGSVGVLNPQCSYQIIITPGNAKGGLAAGQIGVVEDIQDEGVGGGGPGGSTEDGIKDLIYRLHESINSEVEMIEKTVIEVDENSQTLHFINRILEGGFPFGSWYYVSTDKVVFKKNQTTNNFEIVTIDHLSIDKKGIQIGLETDFVLNSTSQRISRNKTEAWLDLLFTVNYKITTFGIPITYIEAYNKTLNLSL